MTTRDLPEIGRRITVRRHTIDGDREITGTVTQVRVLDGYPVLGLTGRSEVVVLGMDDVWRYTPEGPSLWRGEPLPQPGDKIKIRHFRRTTSRGVSTSKATGIVESAHRPAPTYLEIKLTGNATIYWLDDTCPYDNWEHMTTNDELLRLFEIKDKLKELNAEVAALKAEEDELHESITDAWMEDGEQIGAKLAGRTTYLIKQAHVEHSGSDAVIAALRADGLKHLQVASYSASALKKYLKDLAAEGQDPPEHLAKVATLKTKYRVGVIRSS